MPYYQYLRGLKEEEKNRSIAGLLRLKDALDQQIPKKTIADNLLIATWNIREFDSKSYGDRSQEAIYYIAEILDRFDLIAIQEVNENLKGLNRVLKILGSTYHVIFSDVTEGNSGNHERLAFLFDTRKLSLTGLAGEIVIPPIEEKTADGKIIYKLQEQLARTPFVIGLRSSWFKFMISTVHILYGKDLPNAPRRVQEIKMLSDFLANRVDNKYSDSNNLILLGDFNIYKPTNKTYKEIIRNFYIPKELQNLPSNVMQNKFYDQIAFRGDVPKSQIKAGIFNFFEYVYRLKDELAYAPLMSDTYHSKTEAKKKTRYYKTYWRTFQMSDHLPMWVELKINFSRTYLADLKSGKHSVREVPPPGNLI